MMVRNETELPIKPTVQVIMTPVVSCCEQMRKQSDVIIELQCPQSEEVRMDGRLMGYGRFSLLISDHPTVNVVFF